jgi:hypothetical protein
MSLAYYNVGPGESLSLSLRERGGRKRWRGSSKWPIQGFW